MKKLLLVLALCLPMFAQTAAINDTIYASPGVLWKGYVEVTWPAFTTSAGTVVARGSRTVAVLDGNLAITLYANDGATPSGVAYTATFRGPATHSETWLLAASPSITTLSAVRLASSTSVLLSQIASGGATNGQGLTYNSTSGKWEPSDASGGGAVSSVAGRTGAVVLAQSDITGLTTALGLKADTSALTSHTGNTSNPHSVTKSQVGLGSADNTSDASKPISAATQTALDAKAPLASPTFAGNLTIGSTVLDAGPEGSCTSALRGHIVTTNGAGGVADQRRVCTKAADGSYSWTALGSGSGGGSGVPYTGATGAVDLGAYSITAADFITSAGSSNSGVTCWSGLTSGRICVSVANVAGTEIVYLYPSTAGTAGQVLSDSGSTTCPTLPAGYPSTCHQMAWAAAVSNGTTLPATCAVGAQYILTAQYSSTTYNYYPGIFTCTATNRWIAGGDATQSGTEAFFPPSGGFPGFAQLTAALPSITQPMYIQFTVRDTFLVSSWSVKIGTGSASDYIGANIYDASCNRIGPATTTGALTTGDNYPTGTLGITLGPGTYYLAMWASSLTPTFNYIGDSVQAAAQLTTLNSHVTTKRLATGSNTASQTSGTITWPSACGTLTAYYTAGPPMVMLHN